MAYVPGPWYVKVGSAARRVFMPNDVIEIMSPSSTISPVAVLYAKNWPADADEANARLIAAAPDLRDALAALVQTFHARPDMLSLCGPHEHAQIKAACDALNKAEPGP